MIGTERVKDEIMVQLFCAPGHSARQGEIEQEVSEQLGVRLSTVQNAIRELFEEGEITSVQRDSSDYLEVAPAMPHHAARPMQVVKDDHGDAWICDQGVDRSGDLYGQGCWPCGDLAFTRSD